MSHEDSGVGGFFHRLDASGWVTLMGIILLFSMPVVVTLIVPRRVDSSWTQPSSYYQKQMYEIADPHLYISRQTTGTSNLLFVHHLKEGITLSGYVEAENLRFVAPPELEKYITRWQETEIKLTSRLLLLRKPQQSPNQSGFDAINAAEELRKEFSEKITGKQKLDVDIFELFAVTGSEAFSVAETDGIVEYFVDQNYKILDPVPATFHQDPGTIYFRNPKEFRLAQVGTDKNAWTYDPEGKPVTSLEELTSLSLGFRSRKELIARGEQVYAQEGCWYCHTDQTRTLVQDVVLNGSESFPAPPSSPNEYIYQVVTFPGTRRIGPDMSRVGIKRPARDWHKSHFWAPKTASPGSIMPSFKHFFDDDPSGRMYSGTGVPNERFEAIYQYLMTKGTRITPPTQAWWLGEDPVQTLQIIEGRQ